LTEYGLKQIWGCSLELETEKEKKLKQGRLPWGYTKKK